MEKINRSSSVTYKFKDGTLRYRNGGYRKEVFPEKRDYPLLSSFEYPTNLICPACESNFAIPSEMVRIQEKGYCVACDQYFRGLSDNVVAYRVPTIEMIEELLDAGLSFDELSKNEFHVIYKAYQEMKTCPN